MKAVVDRVGNQYETLDGQDDGAAESTAVVPVNPSAGRYQHLREIGRGQRRCSPACPSARAPIARGNRQVVVRPPGGIDPPDDSRLSSSLKRSASATTNSPNEVCNPRFSSRSCRGTTLTSTSSTVSTVAVRTPPERTAVSPKTELGPSSRSTTRCPSTVL